MPDSLEGQATLLRAAVFAARKHVNQRRKGSQRSPYINHVLDVANLLVEEGKVDDVDVLCAAILHDTVEDTDTTFEEIANNFGANVASLVAEVTDDRTLTKRERKLRQVANAKDVSAKARLIKLADKTCNVRDLALDPPARWTVERRREYLNWAEEVVAGMGEQSAALQTIFQYWLKEAKRVTEGTK